MTNIDLPAFDVPDDYAPTASERMFRQLETQLAVLEPVVGSCNQAFLRVAPSLAQPSAEAAKDALLVRCADGISAVHQRFATSLVAAAKDGVPDPLPYRLPVVHAGGLIYRDVKPGNIILDADGPRIIDFGIARGVFSSGITRLAVVIGTPTYMSPEQLPGGRLTSRSDVFALGAVLALAATSHGPFEAPSIPAVIYCILNDPRRLDPLAGDPRVTITARLASHPGDRPNSSDLILLLKPCTSTQPTAPSGSGRPDAVLVPTTVQRAGCTCPNTHTTFPLHFVHLDPPDPDSPWRKRRRSRSRELSVC